MNVYIFYEHLTREWKAANRLKDALEKRGDKVFIYSIIFERSAAIVKAKKYTPDVIFMPWFVVKVEEDLMYTFVKMNKHVRIVDFHHEELSEPGGDRYFLPKTDYTTKASFHIAWGSYFKDFLTKHGVPEDRVFVTGNLRTDAIGKTTIDKKTLAEKYGLDINRQWILFAEARGFYGQRADENDIKVLLERGTPLKDIEDRMTFEAESMENFISDLNNTDNSYLAECEFIYRPHPGTHAPDNLPDWVKIISERPISDWIENVDLFISCGSTSVFEADVAGKPCVMYENTPTPAARTISGLDKYPFIRSIDEVTPELIKKLSERKEEIYKDYFGEADGNVVSRIVKMTDEITDSKFDESIEKYANKLEKPKFAFTFKYIMYDIVVWFLVKIGITPLAKFPKSAYNMLNDVPYYKKNSWIKKL